MRAKPWHTSRMEAVGLINQDEEFVYPRSERQPGNSLTSMKDKVKQRPWQLMRM